MSNRDTLGRMKEIHEAAESLVARLGGELTLIVELGPVVADLFEGRYLDYAASDLQYHDFRHTLLASRCFIDLAEGYWMAGREPVMDGRAFELGLAAILLHDSGYMKLRSDREGTGAKYTACHVIRSCALAASLLPRLGLSQGEVHCVMEAIRCTGLTSDISRLHFARPVDRTLGCMVATADYLGQLADPDYVDRLPHLFAEFEESNDYNGVPKAERPFATVEDLLAKTPGFWTQFVLPRLERDYEGVYRFLARPYPDGENPYLAAVDKNLAVLRARGLS